MRENVRVTITFPTSSAVLPLVKQYGAIISRGSLAEFNSELDRESLSPLETYLVQNNVPFDLLEYADAINAPKVRKYRPQDSYSKEISCLPYGDEEEDGLIKVSELLKILEDSENQDLRSNLMTLVKSTSFKMDEVEDL